MALHQVIQNLLLLGAKLPKASTEPVPEPPRRLRPLIDALAPKHRQFDAEAIRFGHRYRNGFWSIYLLSALAVLCAMMPLALGWDDLDSYMHSYAAGWVIAEILVIAAVALIYWRGHRADWQGGWLRARTVTELTAWLPLIAPLAVEEESGQTDWYTRAKLGGHDFAAPEVLSLCQANEALARETLAGVWTDPEFTAGYATWAAGLIRAQQAYHARVSRRAHLLRHRVHRITTGLFVVTALAALAHLVIHSRWVSLITTVFPALAAALHGALAQSEAYRLEAASERMAVELGTAADGLRATPAELRQSIREAVSLLLEEHQDWHMLVRPHHLSLG
jgi:hypothetical protein